MSAREVRVPGRLRLYRARDGFWWLYSGYPLSGYPRATYGVELVTRDKTKVRRRIRAVLRAHSE